MGFENSFQAQNFLSFFIKKSLNTLLNFILQSCTVSCSGKNTFEKWILFLHCFWRLNQLYAVIERRQAISATGARDSSVAGSGGQNDDFRPLTYTLGGEGHGVQGQICDILRPQLAMNRFLSLWPHRFPYFGFIQLGGGRGEALILDVEHSTYLQVSMPTSGGR